MNINPSAVDAIMAAEDIASTIAAAIPTLPVGIDFEGVTAAAIATAANAAITADTAANAAASASANSTISTHATTANPAANAAITATNAANATDIVELLLFFWISIRIVLWKLNAGG